MKLHNLIDDYSEKKVMSTCPEIASFLYEGKFLPDAIRDLKRSVKFDVGEVNTLPKLKYSDLEDDTILHIPFPITYFELFNQAFNGTIGILCRSNEEHIDYVRGFRNYHPKTDIRFTTTLFSLVRTEGRPPTWVDWPGYMVFSSVDGKICCDGISPYFKLARKEKDFEDNHVQMIGAIISILLVLSCKNVVAIDNPAPVRLNKKREKKGRSPIFSYKTLHLKQTEHQRKTDEGFTKETTRNSPRLHLRRGHVRVYKNGLRVWVSPAMVGDESKGSVYKTYRLGN